MNAQLEQRTPQWLDARIGRVTGSRIGAVLGHSPWQSRKQLLADMVREALGERVERDSPAMRWGREHEQDALDDFVLKCASLDDDIAYGGWYVREGDAYVGYSPDGYVPGSYLIEVKAPYSQRLPEEVPEHYRDQVQLGMYVMDLPEAALHFWTPTASKTFYLLRDPAWWDAALPQISAFLADFRHALMRPNEYLTDERRDAAWREAARRYVYFLSRQKEAETAVAEAKAALEALAGGNPAEGAGVKLDYVERAGSVDYKRLLAEYHISKEQTDAFRSKPTRYARISVADAAE